MTHEVHNYSYYTTLKPQNERIWIWFHLAMVTVFKVKQSQTAVNHDLTAV